MDRVMNSNYNDLPAPPRLLLWVSIGLFVLILLAVIGGVIYFVSGQRLSALIPYAMVLAALLPVVAVIGAVIFRKHLPRFFLP